MPFISKLGKKSARGFKGLQLPVEYEVLNSQRFRSSAQTYLTRTPTVAGNRKAWTFSMWVKLGSLTTRQQFFGTTGNANQAAIVIEPTGTLLAFSANASQTLLRTNQVLRDPAAWYHIVWAENTTDATPSNRSKLYLNGVQITSFLNEQYPALDYEGSINDTVAHYISSYDGINNLIDGYMADICFVDGLQLLPTQFGRISATTGTWVPIMYRGNYGQNGFCLLFPSVPEPIPTPITINQYSARFRASASAYLSRTPATASGQNQWTYSVWVKLGSLAAALKLLAGNTNTGGAIRNEFNFDIEPSGQLSVWAFNNSSGYYFNRFANNLLRDFSAWYHLVLQFDPDNATSANKINCWVNNQAVTWASSADSGAAGSITDAGYRSINNTFLNVIGAGFQGGNPPVYFADCYMAEINMVSGSLVAPVAFGGTDATTGQWIPRTYSGTYGTNGFYLQFNNPAVAADFGRDTSGNNNTWTANNFSVASDSSRDSVTDYPQNISSNSANYCTINPLDRTFPDAGFGAPTAIREGNLAADFPNSQTGVFCTISPYSGKWYWEFTATNRGGIINTIIQWGWRAQRDNTRDWSYQIYNGSLNTSSGATPAYSGTGYGSGAIPVLRCAVDLDAGNIWWGNDAGWFGSGNPVTGANPVFTNVTGQLTPYAFCSGGGYFGSGYFNFGQRPFAYIPPAGFNPLNTYNLPTPTIVQPNTQMDASLYTGTGASQNITNGGAFQPDFIWIKRRSTAGDYALIDSVRGGNRTLASNNTQVEGTQSWSVGFNSNGFNVNTTDALVDGSGITYVGWQWRAGGTSVTNTAGTIASQISANPTAGFSIVTWTGNGTSGSTIGHGIGIAPQMIMVLPRAGAINFDKPVYHSSVGNTGALGLNRTVAVTTSVAFWNNTDPTATVFTVGNDSNTNLSAATYVAYCFAPIAGYSAFGSYTGNGNVDGPFVYLGFRPRFILLKNASIAGGWVMLDTARDPYNDIDNYLYADSNAIEATSSNVGDINSNGFKVRNTWTDINGSGNTIIYAAFAESPFKFARAR